MYVGLKAYTWSFSWVISIYKVDNLIQNSLLSSPMLTLIQGFFTWLILRSCDYNRLDLGNYSFCNLILEMSSANFIELSHILLFC